MRCSYIIAGTVLGLVLGGFSASSVLAQGAYPSDANPLLDPGSDRRRLEDDRRLLEFRLTDKNGDGMLSLDEITQRRLKVFKRLDKNDNGRLRLSEFRLRRVDLGRSAKVRVFRSLDTDNNKTLDPDEYVRAGTHALDTDDLDNDGQLGTWEFRTLD